MDLAIPTRTACSRTATLVVALGSLWVGLAAQDVVVVPHPAPIFFPPVQVDNDTPEVETAGPPAAADTSLLLKESGESDPALPVALPAGVANPDDVTVNSVNPGREAPASPAVPAAFIISWGNRDHCHSLVVVGRQLGLERPAYVITFMDDTGRMAVTYRACAFRDARGVLHIDARKAVVDGPKARDPQGDENWSPDSMAIFATGTVCTKDDRSPEGESGIVTCSVCADTATEKYQRLWQLAQIMVDGSL
jgi:hypothetical protein